MQQKQGFPPLAIVAIGVTAAILGAVVTLMTREVPAPQHAISQPLDAKAFLEQK